MKGRFSSAERSIQRILIVPPSGMLSALYAEPAIRALGLQGPEGKEITVCHEYADLFVGHPAVRGLIYSGAGDLKESFDKIIYLQDKPKKGGPMDWIYEAAHQLGVTLQQQAPQIALSSFDFVRTQRFGIGRLPRPRVAMAAAADVSPGWTVESRQELNRLLSEKMQAGLVYVGGSHGVIADGAKDLRERLMAREIAAVLKQCDLLISEDEEIVSLAAAVQVPAVYICRKTWDNWPAAEGACVVSVYPEKPQDVLEAIGRLGPSLSVQNGITKTGETKSKS